jgi:hypothetical protein
MRASAKRLAGNGFGGLQAVIFVQDLFDIAAGFLVGGDAVVPGDGTGAGVIGAEGAVDLIGVVLVLEEKIAEEAGAAFDVFTGIVGVDVEGAGGIGHELHDADSAFGGAGGGLEGGFDLGDGEEELGGEAGEGGGFVEVFAGGFGDNGSRGGGCGGGWWSWGRGRGVEGFDGGDGGAGDFDGAGGVVDADGIADDFMAFGGHAEAGVEDNILGGEQEQSEQGRHFEVR